MFTVAPTTRLSEGNTRQAVSVSRATVAVMTGRVASWMWISRKIASQISRKPELSSTQVGTAGLSPRKERGFMPALTFCSMAARKAGCC